MFTQFFSIGFVMLLSAMLPGPDFAIVTRNTLLHSRRAGIFTTIGITSAIVVHMTYCLFGLALIISQSLWLFNTIKYLGAAYLIYIGLKTLFAKPALNKTFVESQALQKNNMKALTAFRQGFLCNLLNPKATLFFLALFTVIIKPGTPTILQFAFAIEMLIISTAWFSCLTILLSHPRVLNQFNKLEKYIEKVLGGFLVSFGVILAFVK